MALLRVQNEHEEIREERSGSHTPNQLRKQLSLKKAVRVRTSVLLNNGFHTNQLWREDPWRYPVVEVLLELQQLTHEVEVWGNDGPSGFDKLVGVCHGHPGVLHQVGNHDGG